MFAQDINFTIPVKGITQLFDQDDEQIIFECRVSQNYVSHSFIQIIPGASLMLKIPNGWSYPSRRFYFILPEVVPAKYSVIVLPLQRFLRIVLDSVFKHYDDDYFISRGILTAGQIVEKEGRFYVNDMALSQKIKDAIEADINESFKAWCFELEVSETNK